MCPTAPKKSRFTDKIGERYGSIEYSGGKVLQRWRGSGGNVRLSHLLMSFLYDLLLVIAYAHDADHFTYYG